MEPITLEQFALEVSLMREAQKESFKYRNPSALKKSIHLEGRVDQLLRQMDLPKVGEKKQGEMFA